MSNSDFRRGRHVVYDLNAHIVLTPKYRKKVMTDKVSATIKASIEDTCNRFGIEMVEFNTDKDHAHILINYPPKHSLSNIVRAMKTNSSRIVRKECADELEGKLSGDHFWSPSYFVSSTGGSPLEKAHLYVENQGK